MDTTLGTGTIISVNSWGYTDQPGMAGPQLDRTTAGCLLSVAATAAFPGANVADGDAGVAATLDPDTCAP